MDTSYYTQKDKLKVARRVISKELEYFYKYRIEIVKEITYVRRRRIKSEDRLKREIEFYRKKMEIAIFAPYCYEKLYNINHDFAIWLMGIYLKAVINNIDLEYGLEPLKKLFKQPWIHDTFRFNKEIFVNEVFPIIIELGQLEFFKNIGMEFSLPAFDSPFPIEESSLIERNLYFKSSSNEKQIIQSINSDDVYNRIAPSFREFYKQEKRIPTLIGNYNKILNLTSTHARSNSACCRGR